jgi:ketosteroid isomerase-like protein
MMTTREVVENYFAAIQEGRFEDLSRYQSIDYKRWISGEGSWPFGGWQDEQSMAKIFLNITERFPAGLKIIINSIIVEDDRAVVNLSNYAVRTDGRVYNNQIVFMLWVKDGQITEQHEYLDTIMVNELFCGPLDQKQSKE